MSSGISFRGVLLDQQTISALQDAESKAGFTFSLSQGSFSTGVAASGGTHDGGGALDASVNGLSTDQQVAMVKALRQAGFAAWRRTPADGFVDHVHAVLIGDPLLSPAAQQQVPAYNAGLNGLANGAKDTNPIDIAAGLIKGALSPVTGAVGLTGVGPDISGALGDAMATGVAGAIKGIVTSLLVPVLKWAIWAAEAIGGTILIGFSFVVLLRKVKPDVSTRSV